MKYILFPISIFLFSLFDECKSQNLESIIKFGDSLSYKGNYSYALNEYQRAFFFGGNELKYRLGLKMADCYFAMTDYKLARTYYDSALNYLQNDGLEFDLELRKVLCYIMEDNFGYALVKLNGLEVDNNEYLLRRKHLYQGICCFGMEQYDEAYQYFLNSITPADTLKRMQFKQMYKFHKKLKQPKSSIAMTMSIIIPGTGQIYAGDIKDGINSFLLLGGMVYLAVYGTLTNPIIIIPFFYRYYMGGIINTKQAAEKKRIEKQYYFYINLMEILLK
jgi:tetratricopeptide (TPR) repeat protein